MSLRQRTKRVNAKVVEIYMSEIENAKKLFFEALEFLDSGDFQKAELRLRDALRLTPDSVSVLTNLAVVLLRRNEFCEAREYAEKAVSARACLQLSRIIAATNCTPARKFLASLS